MNAPKKVAERVSAALKRFIPVLNSAYTRDVNESDTVMIVSDILQELFGFDKYSEITSELAIRGTYCDLAIRTDGAIQMLIEVKAIGLELKDQHVKQAVDYAANQGVEWVVLTNGRIWRIYRVIFAKPITQELVFEVNLLEFNPRLASHIDTLYLLTREGLSKSALPQYYAQQQLANRFFMAALLQTQPVLEVIRKEIRHFNPDIKLSLDEIQRVLVNEVIKREALEGERAAEAAKTLKKFEARRKRTKAKPKAAETPTDNNLGEGEFKPTN
jgi:hypothetical protein